MGALSELHSIAIVFGGGSSDTDGIKRERDNEKPFGSQKKRRVAGAAGIRARKDEEDTELVKCVDEMSKAVIAIVNGMSDEKDSDILEDIVQSTIKEEMKESKETLACTSKCVE